MCIVRQVVKDDLDELLRLYQHLHPGELSTNLDAHLHTLWGEMLADGGMHILVAEEDVTIVASCVLMVVVRNLTRGAHPPLWTDRKRRHAVSRYARTSEFSTRATTLTVQLLFWRLSSMRDPG